MRSIELRLLRRQIDAFIKADPRDIVIERQPKIDSGNGSWTKGVPAALPAQQVRLIPFKRRLTHQQSHTQDGPIPLLPYVLIGRYNLDIERDDEFTLNGDDYKVVGVEPKSNDRPNADRLVIEIELRAG